MLKSRASEPRNRVKEARQYGEYRTRRLVFKAWNRMEATGDFSAMGM